jgi:hypothetical protein
VPWVVLAAPVVPVGSVVGGLLFVTSTCTRGESGMRVCVSAVHPEVGGVANGLEMAGAYILCSLGSCFHVRMRDVPLFLGMHLSYMVCGGVVCWVVGWLWREGSPLAIPSSKVSLSRCSCLCWLCVWLCCECSVS